MMKLFDVVTIEDALEIMNNNFELEIGSQKLTLIKIMNRYLAQDIKSEINVPHFRKSLVDGYAVLASDVFTASESNPVPMKVIDEIKMGQMSKTLLEEETCVYVPTGGMVPDNCEGIIMIEYTEKLDEDTILIQKGISYNENIVEIGEDIKIGEDLYKKGHYINNRDIGVLAGANIKEALVYNKIKVGIISTGDEILSIEEDISDAKIKDINAYILYGQLKEISCEPIIYKPVKDKLDDIIKLIEKANKECDIVLISGGSSVGKKDETVRAIKSFENSNILIEGIAIKPGKPTIIGKINEKLIIGLPGHPLSCGFVVEAIVKPFILNKYKNYNNRFVKCEFKYNYHKAKGREEFLAVDIIEENDKMICTPIFSKSSMIKHFAKCDGYIRIERDVEGIKKGEEVKVYLF